MSFSKHIENRNDYQTPALLDYIRKAFSSEDARHQTLLDEMQTHGLPAIQIGASEGKILQFLIKSCQAKKAVEIGTLGGYSALWIADALPKDGKLYTMEIDPDTAAGTKKTLKEVGLSDKVSIVIGDANETLETIEPFGPFDFCFIDADKISYPNYLLWAERNLCPGGIVAADNAYLFGQVHLNPDMAGADAVAISAMQSFIKILTDPSRFSISAMIPTGEGLAVGIRGRQPKVE
ncbi:MAG: O-methyltransferase [Nitrospirae bacterium]|nr:O-methyltransferase [Candidatus Troglogloeales bacterium]MBI3598101.1 O-methyltransferase [Candidatus Troglogloeales bacterium]